MTSNQNPHCSNLLLLVVTSLLSRVLPVITLLFTQLIQILAIGIIALRHGLYSSPLLGVNLNDTRNIEPKSQKD